MFGLVLMVLRQIGASMADEELMERYRDGDAAAFAELLNRYERPVFNFVYRLVHQRELANDLMQETFLRVIKNAKHYSRKARFSTWLYTIARNQCIDELRKAKHRRHPSLEQPQGPDADGPTLLDRLPSHQGDGLERTDAHQLGSRIEDALARLSDEQREVFVMRQLQNLKFKEIADVVGVSENTIKSRMRYALENLRLWLADYAEDVPDGADPVPARSRV